VKYIDVENWPRKKHFEFFNGLDYPHFNLAANVNISILYPFLKNHHLPFFKTILYIATETANSIPEFRQRIRNEQIVEHEVVHPSVTVMTEHELFSFCPVNYTGDFLTFLENATRAIEEIRKNPTLEDDSERDDYLFMTSIPWISFTGFMHPIHMHPVDSVPRIAWGKIFHKDNSLHMPLSVQGHHGLMDGLHAGRYFARVQELLDHPEEFVEARKSG